MSAGTTTFWFRSDLTILPFFWDSRLKIHTRSGFFFHLGSLRNFPGLEVPPNWDPLLSSVKLNWILWLRLSGGLRKNEGCLFWITLLGRTVFPASCRFFFFWAFWLLSLFGYRRPTSFLHVFGGICFPP